MPLTNAQKIIADSKSRFRVAVCGRRFGKSYLAIREMARFASMPKAKVCYVAPTYGQAKQTIWELLKERLTAINWIAKVNESSLTITLRNDSIIMLRSADNYDSMRGMGLDFVVFDEFADIKKEAWTSVIRPALSDKEGHALFLGTPKGVGNWAKELFDYGSQKEDWKSFQFTTLDGGNVSEEEIEAAKDDLDSRTFRQEYMATFETYANAIYYAFDQTQVISEDIVPQKNEIIHIGMDFNTNPMSAVCGVFRNNKLFVIKDIEIYGSNTQEMCDEIKALFPDNRIYVYPDASGANASTKGQSDHTILRNNGFVIKSGRSNPPVRDRIATVNSALKTANNETKLFILNTCKRTINCLIKHTYKGETRQPDKDSGFDHLADAIGYLTVGLLPIKSITEQSNNSSSLYAHG